MTLLELLRNTAFWTLDYIKGGRVRKYMSTLLSVDRGGTLQIIRGLSRKSCSATA